jgi:hypothetical protein
MEGVLCAGPNHDKKQTFVLFDEWVPVSKSLSRDHSLKELAKRYFTSRGPATLQDFIWWSGLLVVDAKRGLEANKSCLAQKISNGKTYWTPRSSSLKSGVSAGAYLLPGFDEYLLGYRERSDVLDARHAPKVCPGGNGMFKPTVVMNGRVVGTWTREVRKKGITVIPQPFVKFKSDEKRDFMKAVGRYGQYLGQP